LRAAEAKEARQDEALLQRGELDNQDELDRMRLMSARLLDQMRGTHVAGASADRHQRSRGKQWHFLPEIFVLVSEAGASGEGALLEPRVYTLKEQQGFYDLGMGYTSPAYVHSLVVFEEAADAERYAGLLHAAGSRPLRVQAANPRVAFVFSVKLGMKISFVPGGTLLLPPTPSDCDKQDAPAPGDGKVASSVDMPWRPGGKNIFSASQLKSMGLGDGVDYDEERRRFEELLGRDD